MTKREAEKLKRKEIAKAEKLKKKEINAMLKARILPEERMRQATAFFNAAASVLRGTLGEEKAVEWLKARVA